MYLEKHSDLLFNADWRTLIVLDSCRFDFFTRALEKTEIEGILTPVDSEARNTPQWYRNHWRGDQSDTVLISSNPQPWADGVEVAENFCLKPFCSAEDPHDQNFWQHPDETIELYKTSDRKGKRSLVHFIPPHMPFLGRKGQKMFKELGISDTDSMTTEKIREWANENTWRELENIYEENILFALGRIQKEIHSFEFPLVISSDHGELIGERNIYGHPPEIDHPALRIVPWLEVEE